MPGAASSVLPTSPIAAVPSRTAAAAACSAAKRRRSRGRSAADFRSDRVQGTSPSPPGTASASADSSRWQCALTSPGTSTPWARSSAALGNSARSAARVPTIRTVPSSSSATAPSAMGGRSTGTTQRALMIRMIDGLGGGEPLVAHVAAPRLEPRGPDVAFDVGGAELEDGPRLRHHVLLDHRRAEVVAAEAQADLADLRAHRGPGNLQPREVVEVEPREREDAQVAHGGGV